MPTTLGTIIGEGFSSIIREDDNGRVYYKPFQWKWPGAPLLGMEKFVRSEPALMNLFKRNSATWVLAPNHEGDPLKKSTASSHGAFDDDRATVQGTLARILGNGSTTGTMEFSRSASSRRDIRARIQNQR